MCQELKKRLAVLELVWTFSRTEILCPAARNPRPAHYND